MLERCHLRRMNKSGENRNLCVCCVVLGVESSQLSRCPVGFKSSGATCRAAPCVCFLLPPVSLEQLFLIYNICFPWQRDARLILCGTRSWNVPHGIGSGPELCSCCRYFWVAADARSQEAVWAWWPWAALSHRDVVRRRPTTDAVGTAPPDEGRGQVLIAARANCLILCRNCRSAWRDAALLWLTAEMRLLAADQVRRSSSNSHKESIVFKNQRFKLVFWETGKPCCYGTVIFVMSTATKIPLLHFLVPV